MSEPAFATAFAAGFPAASAAIALPDDRIDAETTARMTLRNTADRFIRPLLLLNGASRIPRDAIRNVLLRRPPGCAQYTISVVIPTYRFRGNLQLWRRETHFMSGNSLRKDLPPK